jgi:hypothetical protein
MRTISPSKNDDLHFLFVTTQLRLIEEQTGVIVCKFRMHPRAYKILNKARARGWKHDMEVVKAFIDQLERDGWFERPIESCN